MTTPASALIQMHHPDGRSLTCRLRDVSTWVAQGFHAHKPDDDAGDEPRSAYSIAGDAAFRAAIEAGKSDAEAQAIARAAAAATLQSAQTNPVHTAETSEGVNPIEEVEQPKE